MDSSERLVKYSTRSAVPDAFKKPSKAVRL
jgi:hypothetical protein